MTKGYKATYNYKCRNQVYEVGQEYKMDEKPILCYRGFHYCVVAKNVCKFYTHQKDFKLLEIEDLSNETFHAPDKSCSNHIKIIREITDPNELAQLLEISCSFNDLGQMTSYKEKGGYWYTQTFDEQGKRLSWIDSNNNTEECVYDVDGSMLTSIKNVDGLYIEHNYSKDGVKRITKSKYGTSSETIYNLAGRILKHVDSDGYYFEYTYDETGRVLTQNCSNGWNYEYIYHSNGSVASYKDPNHCVTYDLKGNETSITYFNTRTKCPA